MEVPEDNTEPAKGNVVQAEDWAQQIDQRSTTDGDRDTMHRRVRPGIVALIALFQFSKAAFLILVVALVWQFPDMQWGSLTFWGIVYIASHGGGAPGFMTPLIAAYAAVIGWGLWSMKKWARNLLMITSGFSVVRWARYLFLNSVISGTELSKHLDSLKPGFEQQSVYVLILLDVLVFCCLAFYPDVAEAFAKENH
jgi:hypothetical protein